MKKSLIILLLCLFLCTLSPKEIAKGLKNISVSVNPSYINSFAEYKISFIIDKDLKAEYDKILIQFPKNMSIPCTSCAYAHCSDCFLINGINAASVGLDPDYEKTIFLRPRNNFKSGTKIEIIISQNAGFKNPSTPGKYKLKVWTNQEPEPVESEEFEITSTKLENLEISLEPNFINKKSKLKITFRTGRLGSLLSGANIFIIFPEEFVLPNSPKKEQITVNKEIPREVSIIGNKMVIKIDCFVGIFSNVEISIQYSFGIINPAKSGNYTFIVWTESEIDPVSASIIIKEENFVQTLIQTEPIEPDGLNGFFISNILVYLMGETNTSEEIETFYRIDEGEFNKYTGSPFTLPEGSHTVFFYSSTKTLTEEIKSQSFNIDLTPPEISVSIGDTFFTFNDSVLIHGSISEAAALFINGSYFETKDSKSFEIEFKLNIGLNSFILRANDMAGNYSTKQLNIVYDPTTPVFTIESPSSNWQQFKGATILIKGFVYPENCYVYLNEEKISTDSDGKFEFNYSPKEKKNLIPINLKAVYPLTGKSAEKKFVVTFEPQATEIMLTIGKKEIISNGKISLMDTAPFIDKASSRTLVPVRFVSEIFGFEVSWNSETKEVTIKNEKTIILKIGSKTAYVDGKPFEIDVAPVIKDSRTFVPLRFISEVLGFNVQWDGETQTIKISR